MPRTITIYDPQEVADFLKANGIHVSSVSEWSAMEDGEVTLDDNLHVQVGEGYLVLSEVITDHDGTMLVHEIGQPKDLDALLTLIKS